MTDTTPTPSPAGELLVGPTRGTALAVLEDAIASYDDDVRAALDAEERPDLWTGEVDVPVDALRTIVAALSQPLAQSEVERLREALRDVITDLTNTYDAAKLGKPLTISIGQFRRLTRYRDVLHGPASLPTPTPSPAGELLAGGLFTPPFHVEVNEYDIVFVYDADDSIVFEFNTHTQLPLSRQDLLDEERDDWKAFAEYIADCVNTRATPPNTEGVLRETRLAMALQNAMLIAGSRDNLSDAEVEALAACRAALSQPLAQSEVERLREDALLQVRSALESARDCLRRVSTMRRKIGAVATEASSRAWQISDVLDNGYFASLSAPSVIDGGEVEAVATLVNQLHYAVGSERLAGDWRTKKLLSKAARTIAALRQTDRGEAPCRHEWYLGQCAHCELTAKEYRIRARADSQAGEG